MVVVVTVAVGCGGGCHGRLSWLVSFLGFCFVLLHWFGCVGFSRFLFCSSSLVLMGTVGLWLCSDFYGFDGGCGGVLVAE